MRVARVLAAMAVAVGLVAPSPAAGAAPGADPATGVAPAPETVARRVVVRWAGGDAVERARLRTSLDLSPVERDPATDVELLETPADVAAVIASLRASGLVASAEPEFVLAAESEDPGYPQQWALRNDGQTGGTAGIDIDAPEAWATTRGSPDVVVAVVDTGVDISHPDLAANIWVNADEVPGNGVDDDRNGYVDDVNGWDFLADDPTVFDSERDDLHGTHVAGTIAAVADNRQGIAGVAPRVRIMPLKFMGATGQGGSFDAAEAIAYAQANGARVVNASWGGDGGDMVRQAIAAASGLLVVAAAGNDGRDVDAGGGARMPGAWAEDSYGLPNIVSVTSVEHDGSLSSFANFGARSVDLGAPGGRIVSTVPGGLYGTLSGTSMAVPHVSGIAALVASARPSASPAELADAVKAGARPLASLAGRTTTGGLANAAGALAAARPLGGPDPAPPRSPGARTLDHACPGLPGPTFLDVAVGGVHAPGIACAQAWGVVTGAAGNRFLPAATLTRAQLASVLARTVERAAGRPLPAAGDTFRDDDGSVHEPAIDALAAIGIVTGVGPGSYRPAAPVTRGQFATMLARTYALVAGRPLAGGDAFADDDGTIHERAIDGLASIGVVAGTSDGRFQPNAGLPRAHAATMVARLLDALVEAGATPALQLR